jgi:O-antigen/teichoic acid export membrane protein
MTVLKKSALGIYLSSIAQILVSLFQGFVLVPLFLSTFGRELYGAWLALAPILAWLSIMDPGFTDTIRANLARANGANDKREMGRVIGSWIGLQVLILPVPPIAGYLLAPYVPKILGVTAASALVVQHVFFLSSLVATLLLLNGSLTGVLHGLHLGMASALISAATSVVGLLTTLYLVLRGFSVESIPWGLLIRVSLSILVLAGVAIHHCRRQGIPLDVSIASVGISCLASVPVLVNKISSAFFRNIDTLVVSRMLGVSIVPTLTLTQRAGDLFTPLLSGSSQALMPSLAHFAGARSDNQFAAMTRNLLQVNIWVLIVAGGTYVALNQSFVPLWVGPAFFGGQSLTLLLFAAAAVDMMYYVLFQASLAAGLVREAYLNGAILNLVRAAAVVALTYALGLRGIPLGAASATAGVGIVLLPRLSALQPGVRSLGGLLWKGASSMALAATLGLLWAGWVPRAISWFQLALQGIAVSSLLLALLATFDIGFRRRLLQLASLASERWRNSEHENGSFRIRARTAEVLSERD